ncbi:MAG: flagellar hook-basal body complex protein FliE [Pseudomonadota bacterium]
MSGISGVDQVLGQIRAMRSLTQPGAAAGVGAPNPLTNPLTGLKPSQGVEPVSDFSSLLKSSVQAVNATQQQAQTAANAWERGDSEVSLTQVMVSLQKADVSFKAMMEVRNKMVDAYQEVMRMSI